jgi:hypothetical protein
MHRAGVAAGLLQPTEDFLDQPPAAQANGIPGLARGEGGLAVRLQLRRPQPDPAAQAHRATTRSKAQEAVCLKTAGGYETALHKPFRRRINTPPTGVLNRFQSRQRAKHQSNRPTHAKFNKFLEVTFRWFAAHML